MVVWFVCVYVCTYVRLINLCRKCRNVIELVLIRVNVVDSVRGLMMYCI